MDNQDMINPQNSFNKLASLSLPKVTLTFLPLDHPIWRWWRSVTAKPFIRKIRELATARGSRLFSPRPEPLS